MRYKNVQDDVAAAFGTIVLREVIEQGLIKGMDVW